jgi:hypothetical protein
LRGSGTVNRRGWGDGAVPAILQPLQPLVDAQTVERDLELHPAFQPGPVFLAGRDDKRPVG